MCDLGGGDNRCILSSRGEHRRAREKALRARKRAARTAKRLVARRAVPVAAEVVAGEQLSAVEGRMGTSAQPSEVLVNRTAFQKTIAAGFPRMQLVEVEGDGDGGGLLDRAAVVVDRVTDDNGRVLELVLDDGQHLDVNQAAFEDGLVRLPLDGRTTGLFWVGADDRPAVGAADLRGVPEIRVKGLQEERDRFAAVAGNAIRAAREARPANLSDLVEVSDGALAAVRAAQRSLVGAWCGVTELGETEWKAVAAERDAPARELLIDAVEAWHRKFEQVEKNISNTAAKRRLVPHEETWRSEMGRQKKLLGDELRRLRS